MAHFFKKSSYLVTLILRHAVEIIKEHSLLCKWKDHLFSWA